MTEDPAETVRRFDAAFNRHDLTALAEGHVRGVDVMRVRDGRVAESFAYVKG